MGRTELGREAETGRGSNAGRHPKDPRSPLKASGLSQVPTCTQGFPPGCVAVSPVSLMQPPSSSVWEGVTSTSIKVIPRPHLQLIACRWELTPRHTYLVSSQGPEAGSGGQQGANIPTREGPESRRPSRPATGDPSRRLGLAKARAPYPWRAGGRGGLSLLTSQDTPLQVF